MDLSSIPVVDNHAHSLSRAQPETAAAFRTHFTEAHSPLLARDHVSSAIHYRWALKQLGTLLDVDPAEDAILGLRRSQPIYAYARALTRTANLEWVLIDEGYPPPGEAYPSAELELILGVRVGRMLRIETLVENLISSQATFDDFLEAFDGRIGGARESGYVALKSIAAYRTGLDIDNVSESDASAAFADEREKAGTSGTLRLQSKPLIDFCVWRAARHAARQNLPFQFHTGYGDPDLDLRLSNPLYLRPLFEDASLEAVPIVLLHESYPFTAEAAYLAASYPNAYIDVAFSLPPLDRTQGRRSLEIALGVAPSSKVMVSSDGVGIPEHYALGALRARLSIGDVLGGMIADGQLYPAEAQELAELILRANAIRVYALGESKAAGDSL